MSQFVTDAIEIPALKFLHQFYAENSHFGKIMISASAIEVLFASGNQRSVFSKDDKKDLTKALKCYFGVLPKQFENLISSLREPRAFPQKGRIDLITDEILEFMPAKREEIKESTRQLFLLRNRLAHNPRIKKFDGRKELNFAEAVLIGAVEHAVGRRSTERTTKLFNENGSRESY
jgi:hypothetical protein